MFVTKYLLSDSMGDVTIRDFDGNILSSQPYIWIIFDT
jgi:hypothetical protein